MTRADRIAVHEASHATIARVLKLPYAGPASCLEPNAYAKFTCNDGERSICTLLAGQVAECEFCGASDDYGNSGDDRLIAERLRWLGLTDASLLLGKTLTLVRKHRATIIELATKLKQAGTLDGPSIDDIVDGRGQF